MTEQCFGKVSESKLIKVRFKNIATASVTVIIAYTIDTATATVVIAKDTIVIDIAAVIAKAIVITCMMAATILE
jgi:hypothetical protein